MPNFVSSDKINKREIKIVVIIIFCKKKKPKKIIRQTNQILAMQEKNISPSNFYINEIDNCAR